MATTLMVVASLFVTASHGMTFDAESLTKNMTSERITLDPSETRQLMVTNIPRRIKFVLFSIHHSHRPIRMSYESPTPSDHLGQSLTPGKFVTGTDVGLIVSLDKDSDSNASVYVTNVCLESLESMTSVILYSAGDPVPGGCNQEFDVDVSPFIKLSESSIVDRLDYQLARLGCDRGVHPPSCDTSLSFLAYDVYVYFLPEGDFTIDNLYHGLQLMSTPSSILTHGVKLSRTKFSQRTRRLVLSYPGRGVIYSVVVTFKNRKSAYVPAATINCDLNSSIDSCGKMSDLPIAIFLCLLASLGLVITLRGHSWFHIQVIWNSFLVTFISSIISLSKYSSLDANRREVTSLLVAIAAATVTWMVWKAFRKTRIIHVLMSGLLLGFLIISTILFSTIGNDDLFRSDFNYWSIIGSGTVVLPIMIVPFGLTLLSILSTSIVGSYTVIFSADRFLGGSLSFIVINVFKRASFKDSLMAFNEVPFQLKDILLSVSWAILAVFGLGVQLYASISCQERTRRLGHRRRRSRSRSRQRRSSSRHRSRSVIRPTAPPSEPAVEEFRPLVTTEAPVIVYQTIPI